MAIVGDPADRRPEADLRASGRRGVDQDRVEHGAPRRVEGVDAVRGLDRHRQVVVGVREPGAPHGGRTGGDDRVEKSPPVELDDAAAHERVGGEGVGAVAAAVQHEHVESGPGEEHRGGGTGGASTDDDHIVAGVGLVHGDPSAHRWVVWCWCWRLAMCSAR